jgi:FSR family fosmidomycin resistance protein-like MFS transporter
LNRRVIGLLSFGHLTVDLYAGALPALLFVLRPTLHLSYFLVGLASLVFTITSSVIQPLFGYLSDRKHMAELLPIGCVLCALGLCVASRASSFLVLLALISLCGCGSALYHPEAAKTAAFFSGDRRASAMALFSVGGSIGYACGPGIFLLLHDHAWNVAPFVLFAFGFAVMIWLAFACGPLRRGVALHLAGRRETHEPVAWTVLAGVLSIVAIRAWVQTGLVLYLPYWVQRAGHGIGPGFFVSAFLFSGVAGTLAVGPLADRFGARRVLVVSMLPLTPLLLLFLLLNGFPALLTLAVFGACLLSTFSVTVVMAQELISHRQGMAAGLSNGFASGIGALGSLATGALADHLGLATAFVMLSLLPLLALRQSLSLPTR